MTRQRGGADRERAVPLFVLEICRRLAEAVDMAPVGVVDWIGGHSLLKGYAEQKKIMALSGQSVFEGWWQASILR